MQLWQFFADKIRHFNMQKMKVNHSAKNVFKIVNSLTKKCNFEE